MATHGGVRQGCGHIEDEDGGSDVPFWVLLLGGVGIVIGLSTWGYALLLLVVHDTHAILCYYDTTVLLNLHYASTMGMPFPRGF